MNVKVGDKVKLVYPVEGCWNVGTVKRIDGQYIIVKVPTDTESIYVEAYPCEVKKL